MTKIAPPWLGRSAPQAVCRALEAGGAQALFVGGCVRNALLAEPDSDIDIATDAEPSRVIKLAHKAGLRPVPTGLEHGTITIVVDGEGFEVTTFRRDVETDGRRAVVAFSTHISEDAARRDFTMNALYANSRGEVIDPLGGLRDVLARRLRFIGDAEARIREDYLRALRYFRFHAWYADSSQGFDADALAAIASTLDGIETLSRERIGSEMLKLLGAPDPAPEMAVMSQIGLLPTVLPGTDTRALAPLVHLESIHGLSADPIRRLAALGGQDLQPALRLSKPHKKRLDLLRDAATGTERPVALGFHLKDLAPDALVLRAALLEQPVSSNALSEAEFGARQRFPVNARDLMKTYKGPALGARLRALQSAWIASQFAMTKQELLDLPDGTA